MPLKLVTGPANSAKAGEVLAPLRERLDERPILVVPTFGDVEHSQRELADRGAVFGALVLRFGWLFDAIAERAGANELLACDRATDLQRELVVGQAARAASLRVLRRSSQARGFAAAAVRFIAELERSMIGPEQLADALAKWAGDGPRRGYADEVAELYQRYSEQLDTAGLVDDELFAWRALDALRAAPASWGATPVFVYGFDDFTRLELDAITTLAGVVGVDVTVSLPYEPEREAFKALSRINDDLVALADEHVHLEPSSDHYAGESRTALHRLERNLFGGAPDEPDGAEPGSVGPGEAIVRHVAGGQRAEVELVAAEALALLRAGTQPGDVAVVFRDPGAYGSLVEQVFAAYGIPFSIDRRVPLAHTALGRGLLGLMRCARHPGDACADDLLAYLRSPGRLRKPFLADRLEATLRAEGATGLDRARQLWLEQNPSFELTELDELGAAEGTAAYVARLDRELERLFAAPYRAAAHVLEGPELDDARVFRQARGALADLHRLAVAKGGREIGDDQVLGTVAELPVRLGENPQPDRVQVASPEEVRARRFEAVFVCGLQAGEFPSGSRPDPFLPDDYRHELSRTTDLRLPAREDQIERERYLFYVCASRAERRLVLSSRTSDEEGNPQPESFLLADVRDLFGDALDAGALTRTLSEVTWPLEVAPTGHEWTRAAAAAGPRVEQAVPDGLRSEDAIEDLAGERAFSASALEAFADCPVKWLVDRRLDPEALEPDPEAMVRGSYAHEVLRRTYERLREETGSARVSDANRSEAERILLDELERCGDRFQLSTTQARVRTVVRKLQFDLLRFLAREAEGESAFEPEHFELAFGVADEPAPTLGLEDVTITGRIDRVDVHDGRALVRDYKTGRTAYPVARWGPDTRLQAALYALAVEELLGLTPAGAVYVPLGNKDNRARGLLSEELRGELGSGFVGTDFKPEGEVRAELERARDRVAELVEGIRRGDVHPCPETCSPRGGCSYPSICRTG